jgi:hypothetical protein
MESEYDVFVSYARNDDSDRQVEELVEDLTKALGKRIGRQASIAFDKDFEPSEEFASAIDDKIRRSALMIALISPTYVKRPYTRKEVQSFRQKCERESPGLVVEFKRRVVNVLLFDLSYEDWYPELAGANAHKFFLREGTLDRPLRRTNDEKYREQIEALAKDLGGILNNMTRGPGSEVDESGAGEAQGGLMVFVARPPNDEVPRYQKVVNELRRELANLPAQLLTWEEYSGQSEGREQWTRKAIRRATVSVHLLSPMDHQGVRDSLKLALGAKARQIIWMGFKAGTDTRTNPYRNDIEPFRTAPSPAGLEKIEEMTTAPSEAARDIAVKVREWIEAANPPAQLTVCIDLAQADRSDVDVDKFFEYLKQCGIQPFGSTGDPDDFEKQIPRSKGVVIYYGNVPEDWVTASFNRSLKVATRGEQRRLETWGVYYGPPKNDDKPKESWKRKLSVPIDLLEMNGMDGFREDIVKPLLAKLGVAPPVPPDSSH